MMVSQFNVLCDPKRCFSWCGVLPNVSSKNRYCVELKTFVQPKGNSGKIQKNLLRKEHQKTIALLRSRQAYIGKQYGQQATKLFRQSQRESWGVDYWTIYETIVPLSEIDSRNALVWQILLKAPPTHQLSIYCKPARGDRRVIFVAAFHFQGFRCSALQAAYLCMQFLVLEIQSLRSAWSLVRSPASTAYYLESIEARCRALLPIL